MPKVSILIPCYNAERWVAQAIQSALDQTHDDKEVIVVDDGSTDGSLEIIKSFGDKIRWETGPNRGGNVARNRLLELATGEWLQYLDADDYLLPKKIERQLDEAGTDCKFDLLWSPSIYEYHEEPGNTIQEMQSLEEEDPWIALIRWRLPQTGASLWRKQAVIDAGGWKAEQPCCQEHELYFRLLTSNARFIFCSSKLSVYRQWSTETVCRKDPLATTQARMGIVNLVEQYLDKNETLSPALEKEIFATRIQCARSVWMIDRAYAMKLSQQATASAVNTKLPREPWFPVLYQFLFHNFGFLVAERIAGISRMLAR